MMNNNASKHPKRRLAKELAAIANECTILASDTDLGHKLRTTQTMRTRPKRQLFIIKMFEAEPNEGRLRWLAAHCRDDVGKTQPRHEGDKGSSPQQKKRREKKRKHARKVHNASEEKRMAMSKTSTESKK